MYTYKQKPKAFLTVLQGVLDARALIVSETNEQLKIMQYTHYQK